MHIIKYLSLSIFCIITLFFSSCFSEDKVNNSSKMDSFNTLWKIIDERYCYLETKNIDWDKTYDEYAPKVREEMSKEAFFEVMAEMLNTLEDGHVNLSSAFNVSSYKDWYYGYPLNFYMDIINSDNYLGKDYKVASGLKYKILNDNIGYVYYGSFSNGIGEGNLNEVLKNFLTCRGIIIDIRDNGGGELTNSDKLVSPFVNEKLHVGYITHKTGKGHNEFSKPYATYVEPYKGYSYFNPVVLLTNRKCYSSANDFTNAMRYIPQVTIIGDRTGGGGGLPMSSELPNGWGLRYSSSPMLDREMEHLEFGIEPDIRVDFKEEDRYNNIDTLIEFARKYIAEQ